MITDGRAIRLLSTDGTSTGMSRPRKTGNFTTPISKDIVRSDAHVDDVKYRTDSEYVLRDLTIEVANIKNESYTLKNCKMQVSGSKYIGIQQDEFVIKLYNINFASFAKSLNEGYKYITVRVGPEAVFRGTIRLVNSGIENIVEHLLEIKCLMKVTELLSDMITPITTSSSMNVWAILEMVSGQDITMGSMPYEIKTMTFDGDHTFSGYKKTVIDDIIAMINSKLNRLDNRDFPWVDYTLEQDGIINLFGPSTILEVLNMQPHTGLTDVPQISEDSVSFNSVYKKKLVPGRVVKIDNKYFTTIGGDSAFVWAWDPAGLYVITEVRFELSNYPSKFMCSVKARPFSKYNNFTRTLEG